MTRLRVAATAALLLVAGLAGCIETDPSQASDDGVGPLPTGDDPDDGDERSHLPAVAAELTALRSEDDDGDAPLEIVSAVIGRDRDGRPVPFSGVANLTLHRHLGGPCLADPFATVHAAEHAVAVDSSEFGASGADGDDADPSPPVEAIRVGDRLVWDDDLVIDGSGVRVNGTVRLETIDRTIPVGATGPWMNVTAGTDLLFQDPNETQPRPDPPDEGHRLTEASVGARVGDVDADDANETTVRVRGLRNGTACRFAANVTLRLDQAETDDLDDLDDPDYRQIEAWERSVHPANFSDGVFPSWRFVVDEDHLDNGTSYRVRAQVDPVAAEGTFTAETTFSYRTG